MFKKILIATFTIAALSGCATPQPIPVNSWQPTTRVIEKQTFVQAPVNHSTFQLTYGSDPGLERAFNQYIKTGRAPNIVTSGFQQFAYSIRQQPVIKTKPTVLTVISLQPGEHFTNVTSGDPNRWTYSAALSGSGNNQQTHVLVEPLYPNISTTMTITTDKRIYNLALVSKQDNDYIRNVSFWYPEDMINTWNNTAAPNSEQDQTVALIDLDHANFDYHVSCSWSCPSWKPVRVFDDGKKTLIQFPPTMANRDMPLLFTIENSKQALVNYRPQGQYFVVDRIFQQAVLVMGVGRNQTQVRLTNNRYS